MKKIVCGIMLAAVSACATAPGNISAQYVSPLQYQNYSCEQLGLESQRIGARVGEVTGQQQAKANNDTAAMAVGMVLFWPALFFMANGGDKSQELGRLKGESDAIHEAAIQKNCMSQQVTASSAP